MKIQFKKIVASTKRAFDESDKVQRGEPAPKMQKTEDNTPYNPKRHQEEATKFVLDRWQSSKKYALLSMAPGTGKTCIAHDVAQKWTKSQAPGISFFFALNGDTLKEAAENFAKHCPELNVICTPNMGTFYKLAWENGKFKKTKIPLEELKTDQHSIIFASNRLVHKVNEFIKTLLKKPIPPKIPCVVLDEAHHYQNPVVSKRNEFSKALDDVLNIADRVLMMTSTPEATMMVPSGITHRYTLQEAMRDDVIPCLDAQNVQYLCKEDGPNGEKFSWRQYFEFLVQRDPGKKRVLVFATNPTCRAIEDELREMPRTSTFHITCETRDSARTNIREAIANRQLETVVVSTKEALGEGVNIPQITHLVFVVEEGNPIFDDTDKLPTELSTHFRQKVGRLLRKQVLPGMSDKQVCIIADIPEDGENGDSFEHRLCKALHNPRTGIIPDLGSAGA
jgi:superfamily II DNA or RNA helicase